MRLSTKILTAASGLMLLAPFIASAHGPLSAMNKHVKLQAPASSETTDRKTVNAFNGNEKNTKLFKVEGKVTAISATSVSLTSTSRKRVTDPTTMKKTWTTVTTNYTFTIDAKTKLVRKFKGVSSVNEIAVGDSIRVWATSATNGTAKMIWDKSIWWVVFPGTISALDATNKTFTLNIPWHGISVTTTVKWDDMTKVMQGTTVKTAADLANGQSVKVRGSWNSVGMFILAKSINLQ